MGTRTRNLRLAAAFALFAATAGGLASGLITLHGRDHMPAALLGLLLAVVLAVMFAGLLPWWRRLDHMERDGHLMSWYWGGSFGGGLGVLLLLVVDRGSGQLLMGAVLVWFAQIIGYAVALIAWKVAHRSGEA
jgi:hypothetical protein